jgi:hypothetical protein
MCAPDLSFLIKKDKTILQVPGLQSHSGVLAHFKIGPREEDTIVKVSYDWRTKTLDIIGENEGLLPFDLQPGHYKAIYDFVYSQVGTKEKMISWLKANIHDPAIEKVHYEILTEEGQIKYVESLTSDRSIPLLRKLFDKFPNPIWASGGLGFTEYGQRRLQTS